MDGGLGRPREPKEGECVERTADAGEGKSPVFLSQSPRFTQGFLPRKEVVVPQEDGNGQDAADTN